MKKVFIFSAISIIAVAGFLLVHKELGVTSQVLGPAEVGGSIKNLASQNEIFIDVRTDEEWQAEHVKDALHFDLSRLQLGEVPDLPKDESIAIYCHSGNRAGQALQILQQKGFTHLRNAGGLDGLVQQGMKTCSGTAPGC